MQVRTIVLSSMVVVMTGALGAAPIASAGSRPVTSLSANHTSVSADSPSDAWAVGCECAGGGEHTVILHWDGTRWLRS